MGIIQILSEQIVSQIAAGEIIERPAYVVKELIENAIDARASEITIDIEQGGMKKIVVTDNGTGMTKEDVLLCTQLHATSKISDETDLHAVKTFGFRGEALASIASVSRLAIQSRQVDTEVGHGIEMEFGNIVKTLPVGMPVGTRILVQQLFAKTPVRKKDAISSRSEQKHILSVVIDQALSHPEIGFRLISEGKKQLDVVMGQTKAERIEALLGANFIVDRLPVKGDESYLSAEGLISRPADATLGSSKQYFYVNNRPIKSKLLSQALKDAYGSLLPHTHHPIAILFLTVPFEFVDVNIHPRKATVRFADDTFVYEAIQRIIRNLLSSYDITAQVSIPTFIDAKNSTKPLTRSFIGTLLKEDIKPHIIKKPVIRSVTQIHATYIVVETDSGMFLIDQHAAHERVLFEQLQQKYQLRKKISTKHILVQPVEMKVGAQEDFILKEYVEEFLILGFEISSLKKQTWSISAVPDLFADRDPLQLINEMIAELQRSDVISTIDKKTHRMLTFLACKSAIKAGDVLDQKQIHSLLEMFFATENRYTCPHGRPSCIEFSKPALEKMFHRT